MAQDVYALVTDEIIKSLEKGEIPWQKPWKAAGVAFNRISGKGYSFLNQLLLGEPGEYASFEQWKKVGGKIKPGEKAKKVVFWKWITTDEPDPFEEDGHKKIPYLRYLNVFSISQVEGVKPLSASMEENSPAPIEECEAVFSGYVEREGITLELEASDRAFYRPLTDTIHLPLLNQFKEAEEYYSTAFHEAVHSTGAEKRLCRKSVAQTVGKGGADYSFEELVAELGAAFAMRKLGTDSEKSFKNSSGYIQGWLAQLKKDKRMVVLAAAQAEKAVRYIFKE